MNRKIALKQKEPHIHLRRWFFKISVWIFALVLLIALVKSSDWRMTFQRLMEIKIEVVLICTLGWLSSFVFRSLRFQAEWKYIAKIPFTQALKLSLLHNAAVMSIPLRAGELGYPLLVQKILQVSWQQCMRSLLWLRFQDAVVLLSLGLLLLTPADFTIRIVIFLLLAFAIYALRHRWLRILHSRSFLISQIRAFLHQRSDATGWFWSAANWLVKILVISLLLSNLTGMEVLTSLRGAVAGELSALIPIAGPAGLGTYEAGVLAGTSLPWSVMKDLMSSVFLTHIFFLSISISAALVALVLGGVQAPKNSLNQVTDNATTI